MVRLIPALGLPGSVAVLGSEVIGGPVGGFTVAVAVLVMPWLSTSAWTTVYVAWHVVCCCGANVVIGQVIVPSGLAPLKLVSLIVRPVSVTLPVFCTWNE